MERYNPSYRDSAEEEAIEANRRERFEGRTMNEHREK